MDRQVHITGLWCEKEAIGPYHMD